MSLGTTETGYKNRHGQLVLGRSDKQSNHHNQSLFEIECGECKDKYLANGCDIHIRRCPACQGGKPSSEVK